MGLRVANALLHSQRPREGPPPVSSEQSERTDSVRFCRTCCAFLRHFWLLFNVLLSYTSDFVILFILLVTPFVSLDSPPNQGSQPPLPVSGLLATGPHNRR